MATSKTTAIGTCKVGAWRRVGAQEGCRKAREAIGRETKRRDGPRGGDEADETRPSEQTSTRNERSNKQVRRPIVAKRVENEGKRMQKDAMGPSSAMRASRRQSLQWLALPGATLAVNELWTPARALAIDDEEEDVPLLCDKDCVANLDKIPLQTTESGLQYRDIKVGQGPSPPVGFQVTVNYIAMFPDGRVFDNSLLRPEPYDVRIGTGMLVPGLDEGILTMKTGGVRRLYVPGELSFPKGLPPAPGRPRLPPYSPCMFDVQLLYVPGFDLEDYVEEESASDIAAAVEGKIDN